MTTTEREGVVSPVKRWDDLTPDRFLVGVLALEVVLALSARFRLLPPSMQKGWPVLIASAIAAIAALVLLLWWGDSMLHRRTFHFRLRSLVLLIAAIGIPGGWLFNEIRQAERQRQACEAIIADQWSTFFIRAPGETDWTTYWPRMVLGDEFFVTVSTVLFQGHGATDDLLENLKDLPEVEDVRIDQAAITDAGLVHLKRLPRLRDLYIYATPVTDGGLEHLRSLTTLEDVSLYGTGVTDAGIAGLKQALPNCRIQHRSRLW